MGFNEYTVMKTDKTRRVCAYCNEDIIGSDIDVLSTHSNSHAGFKKYDTNGRFIPGSPETALANFLQTNEREKEEKKAENIEMTSTKEERERVANIKKKKRKKR